MKFIGSALVLAFFLTSRGTPQTAKTPYPAMAPLSQYLMPPVPVPVLAFVLFFALLFGSWFAFSKLPSGWSQDGSRNSAQVTNKSKKVSSMITYREPMINYYVRDPERIAAFYQENFGFVERFRTPETGPAIHIEVALGTFAVGLARIDAARSMHHLDLDPGKPRGEIAIWTDNVDAALAVLRSHGIRVLSEPHDFLVDPPLRAAWVEDPEGNPIQIVCKRPKPASALVPKGFQRATFVLSRSLNRAHSYFLEQGAYRNATAKYRRAGPGS